MYEYSFINSNYNYKILNIHICGQGPQDIKLYLSETLTINLCINKVIIHEFSFRNLPGI